METNTAKVELERDICRYVSVLSTDVKRSFGLSISNQDGLQKAAATETEQVYLLRKLVHIDIFAYIDFARSWKASAVAQHREARKGLFVVRNSCRLKLTVGSYQDRVSACASLQDKTSIPF